jgi:hypothetical protein
MQGLSNFNYQKMSRRDFVTQRYNQKVTFIINPLNTISYKSQNV